MLLRLIGSCLCSCLLLVLLAGCAVSDETSATPGAVFVAPASGANDNVKEGQLGVVILQVKVSDSTTFSSRADRDVSPFSAESLRRFFLPTN